MAHADDFTDELDKARQLYEKHDLKGSSTELGFAARVLNDKRVALYAALFAPAPSGWKVDESDSDHGTGGALASQMMGGAVMVERTYRQDDGDGEIRAEVLAESPMIQSMAVLAANPMYMDKGAKRVSIGDGNAVLKYDDGEKSGELTLVVGASSIKLTGNAVSSDAMVTLLKDFALAKFKSDSP
jgi:hypothetical protein